MCASNEYQWHPNPLGCSNVDGYTATEPFQCRPCTLVNTNRLVVACGDRNEVWRWHPRAERDAGNNLIKVKCDYSDLTLDSLDMSQCTTGAVYDSCEACMYGGQPFDARNTSLLIPYCPPGWRIDTSTCADVNPLTEYNPQCCTPCQRCEPHQARASNWQMCPGDGSIDTQVCASSAAQACLPGEYMRTDGSVSACTKCGECP